MTTKEKKGITYSNAKQFMRSIICGAEGKKRNSSMKHSPRLR